MKILYVVGARPNFMKVAPILRAFSKQVPEVQKLLVHTGQHFDRKMSDVFFEELGIPDPDEHLGVGGGSHAEQTARIMLNFEPVLLKHRPDWLFVVGDVNSTVACSLVASKLGVPIAHVEAGLRSGDMSMPEEVNRRVTDAISSLLLTPSADGDDNLRREGIPETRIRLVGNVMIDTLVAMLPRIKACDIIDRLGCRPREYALVTLHRPSNVDDPATLTQVLDGLRRVSAIIPLVLPVHPRTHRRIAELGLSLDLPRVQFIDPVGYVECLALERGARFVITDSGGMQEETTYLQIPCLTVRPNTERPVTITFGTNQLVKSTADAIDEAAKSVLAAPTAAKRHCPPLWDGLAADRIVGSWREIARF